MFLRTQIWEYEPTPTQKIIENVCYPDSFLSAEFTAMNNTSKIPNIHESLFYLGETDTTYVK